MESIFTTRQKGVFSTGLNHAHVLSMTLAASGVAALYADISVANWIHAAQFEPVSALWSNVAKLCNLAEVFSHGIGVIFICIGVFILDPEKRRYQLRLICCSILAGLAATSAKLIVERTRPYYFLTDHPAGTVSDTFGDWLPILWNRIPTFTAQSFPSAHTSTAVGLAVGLVWLYPHARWYFIVVAILAAIQRMIVEAHYLSDTLFGAALGSTVALICVGPGYLGRLFHWIETRPTEK